MVESNDRFFKALSSVRLGLHKNQMTCPQPLTQTHSQCQGMGAKSPPSPLRMVHCVLEGAILQVRFAGSALFLAKYPKALLMLSKRRVAIRATGLQCARVLGGQEC